MEKSERKELEKRREKLESYLMTLSAEKRNNPGPASVMEESRERINFSESNKVWLYCQKLPTCTYACVC